LRYDGHPALWYLLFYLPAHLSSSPAWMLGINYALTVVLAWLILSDRRMPLILRVLTVFSVSIFFYMGVIARSYMPASVLLVASARCLMAGRRHWLAMAMLALAINSHFFAIPVAAGIFVWMYWLAPAPSWSVAAQKLKDRRFWISVGTLAVALLLCYFTLRPAPDVYTPQYEAAGRSPLGYLLVGLGSASSRYVPFRLEDFAASLQRLLPSWTSPSLVAASLTIGLWLLAVSALSARRSRWLMISVSLVWTAVAWATVHVPLPHHAVFLFTTFVIALMLSARDSWERPWLPPHDARLLLLTLLSLQVGLSLHSAMEEWLQPFSGAKPTAEFLVSAGLAGRPLVIQPDLSAPALLAYTGVNSAYFPTCLCRGAFVVFRRGRDLSRHVSLEELQKLHREFGSVPIVISNSSLQEDELKRLGLRLIYTSPHGWYWKDEDIFVYNSGGDATEEGSKAH
jgi:hypothetical protein